MNPTGRQNILIQVIPAAKRHFSDIGWLKTYWLFSFDDYYDPSNVEFGALRVFNDDRISPGRGFPSHTHREMEIVTIMLEGELTHQDSGGHQALIREGDVQRMSAGTGITHSEFNRGRDPVHLYQIWIRPRTKGAGPSYDQRSFGRSKWRNALLPLASGRALDGALGMNTDSTIFRTELDRGRTLDFETDPSRLTFVYLGRGELAIDGTTVGEGDQARISKAEKVRLEARSDSALVLIDIPPG